MAVTYRNKKVLVTGGAGFIGSHLCCALVQKGAHVVVVDRVLTPSYSPHKNFFKKNVTMYKQDIGRFDKLKQLIQNEKIEIIFHLAAQSLVETAYLHPRETLAINIMGTVNILEAARLNTHIQAIIIASSDKAYGKLKKKVEYRESDPLAGDHPYEVSKSCTDLIGQTYAKTYHLPVTIARFGNVYGEGDTNFSRIIPGIMKAYFENDCLEIRSDGKYVRDYIYVKDVVGGYLLLGKHIKKTSGEVFNLGSENTHSVLQLIRIVENVLHKNVTFEIKNSVKNEIPYQSLDYAKVKKLIGWKPVYKIRDTVLPIYNWYSNFFLSHKNG
jgi:CDP-glucose 4,6-dehydratase